MVRDDVDYDVGGDGDYVEWCLRGDFVGVRVFLMGMTDFACGVSREEVAGGDDLMKKRMKKDTTLESHP